MLTAVPPSVQLGGGVSIRAAILAGKLRVQANVYASRRTPQPHIHIIQLIEARVEGLPVDFARIRRKLLEDDGRGAWVRPHFLVDEVVHTFVDAFRR